MPDVLDFIILRQYYDHSLARNWQQGKFRHFFYPVYEVSTDGIIDSTGDRFRSVIDESWWAGEITERSPYQPEHPESNFQCLEVR